MKVYALKTMLAHTYDLLTKQEEQCLILVWHSLGKNPGCLYTVVKNIEYSRENEKTLCATFGPVCWNLLSSLLFPFAIIVLIGICYTFFCKWNLL